MSFFFFSLFYYLVSLFYCSSICLFVFCSLCHDVTSGAVYLTDLLFFFPSFEQTAPLVADALMLFRRFGVGVMKNGQSSKVFIRDKKLE